MRTRFVPFAFPPLDGLAYTELQAVILRGAGDTTGEDNQALL